MNGEPVTGRPTGDPTFYARLADRYSTLATRTGHPCRTIAWEAAVPVTTVHRWVRTARRLGHLPPTKQGRAGSDPFSAVAGALGVSAERLRAAILANTRAGLLPQIKRLASEEEGTDG